MMRPMEGEEIKQLLASQFRTIELLERVVELLEAKPSPPISVVNNSLGSKTVPTYPPGKRNK